MPEVFEQSDELMPVPIDERSFPSFLNGIFRVRRHQRLVPGRLIAPAIDIRIRRSECVTFFCESSLTDLSASEPRPAAKQITGTAPSAMQNNLKEVRERPIQARPGNANWLSLPVLRTDIERFPLGLVRTIARATRRSPIPEEML
jgi:hypothetical protein